MPRFDKCPECGAELQATVNVDLSNVVVDDGAILSFTPAFGTLEESIAVDEGVNVYCANDHTFDMDISQRIRGATD